MNSGSNTLQQGQSSRNVDRSQVYQLHMPVPKMSFEGDHWNGFVTQFELVAKNFGWSEQIKLIQFALCLKKGAAEYYSILSSNKEKDFEWLKRRFQHHFGVVESAAATRMELLQIEQREDESLENYLARMQKLVITSFPEEANRESCSSFLIDTFMKGCKNKSAVLSAAEKKPKTLEEAYKLVLEATHPRKAILGMKAVSFSLPDDNAVSRSSKRKSGRRRCDQSIKGV